MSDIFEIRPCYVCGEGHYSSLEVHQEGNLVVMAKPSHDNRFSVDLCHTHAYGISMGQSFTINNNQEETNTMTSKPINPKFANVTYCTFCEANDGVCRAHPGPLDFEYQGDIIHVTEGTFDTEGNFVPKENTMNTNDNLCGATTKSGKPCRNKRQLFGSQLCRVHHKEVEVMELPLVTEPSESEVGVKCGSCKGRHADVAEVRACYGIKPRTAPAPRGRYLSDEEKTPYLGSGDRYEQGKRVRKISNPYKGR